MRYLITGGAGFIGSHLAERLLERGDSVIALDNFSTGNHTNVKHLEQQDGFKLIYGSVMDRDLVNECLQGVDRVYHLASAVGVQLIIDRPIETVETIVQGASVVFEACARYRIPVLLTSTSEVYGKSQDLPFTESSDSIIGPPSFRRWAYASAKALDEFLALAYWHQLRLPVVLVRLFNTVGPRQTGQYGMVIPRFVQQALKGQPITVYGTGEQSRCFCHVRDAVTGLVGLLDREESRGELFNVGNDTEISMNGLARRIVEMTNSNSEISHIPYAEAYGQGFEDMERRVPNLQKIKQLTGYTPEHDLDQIIRDVISQFENV